MFNGPTTDSSTLDQNYNIVRTDDVLLVQFNSIFKLNKQKFIAVIVVCDSGGGDGDNNIDKSVNKNNFICFGPSRATRTIPRSHCDGYNRRYFIQKRFQPRRGPAPGQIHGGVSSGDDEDDVEDEGKSENDEALKDWKTDMSALEENFK
ncbi:hypothetical protein PV325_012422 [Microctonus aethiopoides]|nr:hypothetical protein PV325_012422 [Microctonus aethiopoides]